MQTWSSEENADKARSGVMPTLASQSSHRSTCSPERGGDTGGSTGTLSPVTRGFIGEKY